MKFKKLELESENKGIKGLIRSKHFRTTTVSILVGAVAGFGYYYFTAGRDLEMMVFNDAIKHVFLGGFFGFFVTNSPCSRGKC
jgi:hypothetical protein